MALSQVSVRAGNQAAPVNGDLGGSLFKNNGPDTVYYGPDRTITSATGTSVASGASVTLVGTQYLVVASTFGTLAKVTVTPTYTGIEGDAEVLTGLQVTGNTAVGGTLAVTGAQTLTGATAMAGAVTMTKASGTGLAVTANETVGGTLAVTGTSTLTGAVSAAKASGTGLAVVADATVGGALTTTGLTTTGGLSLANATDVTISTSTGSKVGQASSKIGFYGATPAAKPTGVSVDAAGIHAALVTLGLIAA